jgi:hypothetical protein
MSFRVFHSVLTPGILDALAGHWLEALGELASCYGRRSSRRLLLLCSTTNATVDGRRDNSDG